MKSIDMVPITPFDSTSIPICRMVLYESHPRHRLHRERRSPGCLSIGGNGSAVPRHDPQPGCGGFAATGRGGARGSHGSRPAFVTSTFAELTGAPPRTFLEWATDHAAEFRA